jgi:hypothetical protein
LFKEAWDRRRRRVRLSLLLGAAVVAGLGSQVSRLTPTASAALPNPCLLLTNAEVAKAIGNKADTRIPNGNGRDRICTWTGPPLGTFTSFHAELVVQVTRQTKAQFDKGAEATQGAVRIRGAGDTAYTSRGAQWFLETWQNGFALLIMASGGSDNLAAEKTAAKIAFAHL